MEKEYSNYDMLDKLVANNKKAKSWTAFWVIILCLMAGTVLWLASILVKKNEALSMTKHELAVSNTNLEATTLFLDSLKLVCDAGKTAIIKDYDSVITQTQAALNIVTNETSGSNMNLTAAQQKKIKDATSSIKKIQDEIKIVKADIKKVTPRLFIQYNNKDEADRIEKMLYTVKKDNRYLIAPPEYIDNYFPTIIKFYNYKNDEQERTLKEMISRYFDIPVGEIKVTQEANAKIKNTIEIWIGTVNERQRVQQMQLQVPKAN